MGYDSSRTSTWATRGQISRECYFRVVYGGAEKGHTSCDTLKRKHNGEEIW